MKWLWITFVLCVLTMTAYGQNKISLVASGPLLDVVKSTVRLMGCGLTYDSLSWFARCGTVNIEMRDQPGTDVLTKCFQGKPLTFIVLEDGTVKVLPRKVTGYVLDDANHPVEIVQVKTADGKQTVFTGEDGKFTIAAAAMSPTLTFSGVHIETITLSMIWNEEGKFYVNRKISASGDTAYSVNNGQDKWLYARTSASVTTIRENKLQLRNSAFLTDKLESIGSGLYTDHYNQWLDDNPQFFIRGFSTIDAKRNPLIVVDNFTFEGNINNINPQDIESITLLKDAAATSVWGSRAGNGVIVITTHKGQSTPALQFSFSGAGSIHAKPDAYYPPALSSADWVTFDSLMYSLGYFNSSLGSDFLYTSPVAIILAANLPAAETAMQLNQLRLRDVRDDYNRYFYKKSYTQQYHITMSGGNKRQTFYCAAGFDKNISGFTGGQYHRYSFTVNHTLRPLRNLSVNTVVQTSHSRDDNKTAFPQTLRPFSPLADENGRPLPVETDFKKSWTDQQLLEHDINWKYIPLQEAALRNNTRDRNTTRISTQWTYQLPAHFKVELAYQYYREHTDIQDLIPTESYRFRNLYYTYAQWHGDSLVSTVPYGAISDWQLSKLTAQHLRIQGKYEYKNENRDLYFLGLIGAEVRNIKEYAAGGRAYHDTVDFNQRYPIYFDAVSTYSLPGSGKKEAMLTSHYSSGYSNGAISFKGRYTLTGSIRFDRSNLFGPDANQKGIPLGSVGAKYNIAAENFYTISWLPYLQARATYGSAGNVDNSAYSLLIMQQLPNNRYGATPAIIVNPLNTQLHWEKNTMFNTGIDFKSRRERIAGSIDLYSRRGNGLLGYTSGDPTTGIPGYRSNSAALKGSGIDIELNLKNISRPSFGWSTTLLLSHTKTAVVKYGSPKSTAWEYLMPGSTSLQAGFAPDAIFAFKWAGLDPGNGDPMGFVGKNRSNQYDQIFNASPETLEYRGTASPRWFGSIANTFRFKRFDLYCLITGKFGHFFRRPSVNYYKLTRYQSTAYPDLSRRWKKAGDENNTQVPSFSVDDNEYRSLFYEYSSAVVEKADVVRVRDVKLSYRLPKKWQAIVYVSATNLWMWKATSFYMDPDALTSMPAPRSFTVGFTIQY